MKEIMVSSNFKTTIKAQTDDTEIELDASFKRFPSIEGSFNLQTPFETKPYMLMILHCLIVYHDCISR
jgi:hypothetical protein